MSSHAKVRLFDWREKTLVGSLSSITNEPSYAISTNTLGTYFANPPNNKNILRLLINEKGVAYPQDTPEAA